MNGRFYHQNILNDYKLRKFHVKKRNNKVKSYIFLSLLHLKKYTIPLFLNQEYIQRKIYEPQKKKPKNSKKSPDH